MSRIEVRSQAEFDACVKAGNTAIVMPGTRVEAWENSSVVARENSSVVARGNSSVVAWGNSSVVARGNSSVVAWGNSFLRLFSAARVRAAAHVAVMIHGNVGSLEGGQQMQALKPEVGSDWCEFFGLDPAKSDLVVPNIDAAILKAIEANGKTSFDMGSWHGTRECDETNWCKTTHCRAGFAICLAGKAGFDLERKFGPETAGQMIYAVSRPNKPLPDFHASNAEALADMRANAAEATS